MKKILVISAVILLFFLIHSCKKKVELTPPIITTTAVTEISFTTASSGGNLTDIGGAYVTSRGVCWNTSVGPTIFNNKTTETGGLGTFTSNLTQLTPNTMYYVRAYAVNSAGTGYGNEESFTTSQVAVPVLTTTAITSITQTTATSGGDITADNGGSVTARGVCWSTIQNPTTSDSKVSDVSGNDSFTSSITGLIGNTTYYVRAYATNSAGTAYGNQISFITSPLVPTLTTATTSSITSTTASSGGNVTSDGGATVTASGVCWSTSANPTILLSTKTSDVGTTGVFTSSITGLTASTNYYVRAYATNIVGTAYGNEVSFTTSSAVTTVTDIDGNVYNAVTIGTQTWMAENLKTTKYNDGTAIPNITDNTEWAALTTGAYCDYSNTPSNSTTYGRLYNWYVVDNNASTKVTSNGGNNVCPSGWHVPSDAEWTTLTDYLTNNAYGYGGNLSDIAKSMAATSLWTTNGTAGTVGNDQASNNSSGFTALPGGSRDVNGGSYLNIGNHGNWWSSTEGSSTYAWGRYMDYDGTYVYSYYTGKQGGFSVRCVKD